MSEYVLKGGFRTTDRRLDRLPEFDEESRNYPIRTLVLQGVTVGQRPPRSFTWSVNAWLDQGSEGRCVEFSICHDLLGRPVKVDPVLVDLILAERRIYWPAQREDYWPGGSYPGASPVYEGTSVLAGVKVATGLGFYREYRWAFTLAEALLGLGYAGPLLLGIDWHASMFDTDAEGWLHVTGEPRGGHAILAYKLKLVWLPGTTVVQRRSADWVNYLDLDASYVGLWNSWGPGWGINGTAKLSVRNFDALRRAQGECCIAAGRKSVVSLAA